MFCHWISFEFNQSEIHVIARHNKFIQLVRDDLPARNLSSIVLAFCVLGIELVCGLGRSSRIGNAVMICY
jgi:hypothetical protein